MKKIKEPIFKVGFGDGAEVFQTISLVKVVRGKKDSVGLLGLRFLIHLIIQNAVLTLQNN